MNAKSFCNKLWEKGVVMGLLPLLLLFVQTSAMAQDGFLNDDFSTGNTFNWSTPTAGASAAIVNGQFVVTMALQANGKYRGDFQKVGGATLQAGNYPIVAIKFNKPPGANFFFDTNLGSYNGGSNNASKLVTSTGDVWYWDLSTGKLGTTVLSKTQPTALSLFQFKLADVPLTAAQVAANDLGYEVAWVKTFASVADLRAAQGLPNPPPFAFTGTFVHPGLLHSTADLQRIKGFVDNKFGRPYQSYQLLLASSRSSATYKMAGPFQYLTRDASLTLNGVPGGTIKDGVESDVLAAYYNALMWNITGDQAHAAKAVEILDGYSATAQAIVGADAELNGLYGFMLANAAELMRYTYPAWPQQNVQQCQSMLQSVFYPTLQNFKPCAHGNWDIICMKALMAISVFSNDTAMFNRVVNYFYYGPGNGSINNYVLTAAGQLQESNRDQPHVMLALGSLAELSEIADKQGIDLYGASNNAIMRGYEYTAKYNLGFTVDYKPSYDICEVNYSDYTPNAISANGRGQFRSVFEIAYNHYVYKKGQQMPWTLRVMQAMGPEGAPFGADNPGYGSLLFYVNTAPDHPFDTTAPPVDSAIGLIDDNFTTGNDGWAAATSGSASTAQNGQLTTTLVLQSNGKARGDIRKTAGAALYTPNYPILAIKMKKPAVANITFDTNLGSYGNGPNKWTGKVGDDVYYYDLTKIGFGAGPTFLSIFAPTTLSTFQFKAADVTSGEANYTVDWVKTFRSLQDLEKLVPHVVQMISFDSLATSVAGNLPIPAPATSSSGLPISYLVADTTVAKVVNGEIYILKVGTTSITATQPGDSVYLPAQAVTRTLTVVSSGLTVQSLDGDNGQVNNNVIRPYLKLVNGGVLNIPYKELSVRYYLTAENFSGMNAWIDYAQVGNSRVHAQYVPLSQPRDSAFGYIEYRFDSSAGNLIIGGNSGVIQSRASSVNWGMLNETNDYSYANNSSYSGNEHIAVYRNGVLIAGQEPAPVEVDRRLTVSTQNRNGSTSGNMINTYLQLNNEGNVPVSYSDITLRYWFTNEGGASLNYWIDYAVLGNNKVGGRFVPIQPVPGADMYFELKIDSAAGSLYPLSGTGNIQYRIAKNSWSDFDESNDYSWKPAGPFAVNEHVTVYYKGELIAGIEPGNLVTNSAGNTLGSMGSRLTAGSAATIFPNPVRGGAFYIRTGQAAVNGIIRVKVFDLQGRLLKQKRITAINQTVIEVSDLQLATGVYMVRLNEQAAIKLIVQ